MTNGEQEPAIEERVAALLAERHEELVRFDRLPLWNVARAVVRGGDGAESSRIVKWLRSSVQSDVAAGFLRTEAAALTFLGDIEPPIAPALDGATPDLLVIEDLRDRSLLWEMLRDKHPLAGDAYRDFATAMARLHASTVGNLDLWNRTRHSWALSRFVPSPDSIDLVAWHWDLRTLAAVGVEPSTAAQRDLDHVRRVLTDPGPFLAFSNGDPGANNYLFSPDAGRLIDFEYSRFRHALIDAACLHVQHSVWMTIAKPARFGVIDIYRAALAERVPEAEDDALFAISMAGASALRATERLRRCARLDARPRGDESRKQMIATLETAAITLEEYGVLTDLGGWLTNVALTLRRRWSDADVTFPDEFTVR